MDLGRFKGKILSQAARAGDDTGEEGQEVLYLFDLLSGVKLRKYLWCNLISI